MDKISVVIPAYNCENTIVRCVKSILEQTYQELQIIIVDDGSTDNTKNIIIEFCQKDNRIELISIPNGGVSHARNIGIDHATGQFITFVDSDDYVDQEMYSSLMNLINKYDVKIAHCSYKNMDEYGNVINHVGNSGLVIEQDHDSSIEFFLTNRLFSESLCNKIYKADLFQNIKLDEKLTINEDVLANFCLFDSVEKSVFIDKSFYSYVNNSQSATHTKSDILGAEQSLYVARKIHEMSLGKTYETYAKQRVAAKCLNLYKSYIWSKAEAIIKKRKELRKELRNYKSLFQRRNDRIAYFLLMYCPPVYKVIYQYYSKKGIKQLDPIQ